MVCQAGAGLLLLLRLGLVAPPRALVPHSDNIQLQLNCVVPPCCSSATPPGACRPASYPRVRPGGVTLAAGPCGGVVITLQRNR